MSSSYVTKIGRKQSLLLSDLICDYIDSNNLYSLFECFVDPLEINEINSMYAFPEEIPIEPRTSHQTCSSSTSGDTTTA